MKRQQEENINTAKYYDDFFQPPRECTKDRVIRQQLFLDIIKEHHPKPKKVIELASGMSYFLQMVKRDFPTADVWGIDFSTTAKERMSHEESSEEHSVNYVVGDALNTPFRAGTFDVVASGEFIEHLEEPKKLISEMNRLTVQGGIIMVSTPHLETHDLEHLWEFEPEDIVKMFDDCGLKAQYKLLKSDISDRYYIIVWAIKQ